MQRQHCGHDEGGHGAGSNQVGRLERHGHTQAPLHRDQHRQTAGREEESAVKTCRQQEVVLDRAEKPGGENVRTKGRDDAQSEEKSATRPDYKEFSAQLRFLVLAVLHCCFLIAVFFCVGLWKAQLVRADSGIKTSSVCLMNVSAADLRQ